MEMVLDKCNSIGEPMLLQKSANAQPSANEPVSGHGPTKTPSKSNKPETGDRSHTNQILGTRDATPTTENCVHPNSRIKNSKPLTLPCNKNDAPAIIMPIAALDPCQVRWTIKARATAKAELRQYNNPRGSGKVFSFDLLDAEGGEIRATCFNAVADQFYNQIEVGKFYTISRGSLKTAQKNFNHLRNDQEIFLDNTSVVEPCFEDDDSIPPMQFHFCFIRDIEEMENSGSVDLLVVVSSVGCAGSIMRKNGLETHKRALQLKNDSGRSVELTLWGNLCDVEGKKLQNMCDSGLFPVLAVKSARINDFNGKSVNNLVKSVIYGTGVSRSVYASRMV